MPLEVKDYDTNSESILKGLLTGGLSLASIYGVASVLDYLSDKLNTDPRVYSKDIKKIFVGAKIPVEKEGELSIEKDGEVPIDPRVIGKRFLYGVGIPLGAYGIVSMLQFLKEHEQKLAIRNQIRHLTDLSEDGNLDDSKIVQGSLRKKEIEKDAEINAFLDIVLTKQAEGESEESLLPWTDAAYDLAKFIVTKIPEYLPIGYGVLAGLGGLAGYKGMEYLYEKPKDPLKIPIIKFKPAEPGMPSSYSVFTKKQQKAYEKALKDELRKRNSEGLPR